MYKERLKKIVNLSYDILTNKINYGNISVDNEAGFQLQFAYILKSIGELYRYSINDIFSIELEKNLILNQKTNKSKTNKAKIDIFLSLSNGVEECKCAIELKYFKKENHREPNNRYDVFNDINNLELYIQNDIDIGYFIVGTDHSHYVSQKSYSCDTKDFDFRDGGKYTSGTVLSYRTNKPYGEDIVLKNDYEFKWDTLDNKHFMKLQIE